MMPKMLCSDKMSELGKKILLGKINTVNVKRVDADILYVHLEKVDKKILDNLPNLRYVVCPCTGVDHIDIEAVHKRGAKLVHISSKDIMMQHVRATSEFTFAILMTLVRKISIANEHCSENSVRRRHELTGHDLHGKTLGIIGIGRIGTNVAAIARGFGMRVLGCDNHKSQKKAFEEILRGSDFITIHAPLNNETEGMIGAEEFAVMGKKPFIVNTARSKIIQEDALVDALKYGVISGAALDVYEGYSLASIEYLKQQAKEGNVLLTQHNGGNTIEARELTDKIVLDKLITLMRNDGTL